MDRARGRSERPRAKAVPLLRQPVSASTPGPVEGGEEAPVPPDVSAPVTVMG
jgi:hypothetical protein